MLVATTSANATPLDSIGVENYKGKKVVLHKVERKETYYAIARRYGVPYQEIIKFNDAKILQPGETIKVLTTRPFASVDNPTLPSASSTGDYFEYTVQKKDNLNRLAERFGTTVDAIKAASGIRSINLQIGQVLHIPKTENQEANSTETATSPQNVQNPPNKGNITTPTTYTVKKKDNLNLIARLNHTTVEAIKEANGLTSNNLQIGQILKMPGTTLAQQSATLENNTQQEQNEAPNVATNRETEKTKLRAERQKKDMEEKLASKTKESGFVYMVAEKDNIYTIAKKFNLTTYQLTSINKLESNELKVGQKLIIPHVNKAWAANTNQAEPGEDSGENTLKDPSLKLPASRYGLTQVEEKGTALWIDDKDLDENKMLVLHRNATIGTVIKITNPMTNRSAFAKVVGKFTENETTKDVIIVMTKAVAESVGALDKRFYCNLMYGAPENVEQQ